jgi:hypothetical protein
MPSIITASSRILMEGEIVDLHSLRHPYDTHIMVLSTSVPQQSVQPALFQPLKGYKKASRTEYLNAIDEEHRGFVNYYLSPFIPAEIGDNKLPTMC